MSFFEELCGPDKAPTVSTNHILSVALTVADCKGGREEGETRRACKAQRQMYFSFWMVLKSYFVGSLFWARRGKEIICILFSSSSFQGWPLAFSTMYNLLIFFVKVFKKFLLFLYSLPFWTPLSIKPSLIAEFKIKHNKKNSNKGFQQRYTKNIISLGTEVSKAAQRDWAEQSSSTWFHHKPQVSSAEIGLGRVKRYPVKGQQFSLLHSILYPAEGGLCSCSISASVDRDYQEQNQFGRVPRRALGTQ